MAVHGRQDPALFAAGLALVAGLAALLLAAMVAAHAEDRGQFGDIAPAVREWFKGVRSPHGVPCCDMADGHRTDYDIRGEHYWVPIEGTWVEVPPESIVFNAGNPYGQAVVWWVRQGPRPDAVYIRCFVPGGGV